jgi:hypothetical protein
LAAQKYFCQSWLGCAESSAVPTVTSENLAAVGGSAVWFTYATIALPVTVAWKYAALIRCI